MFKAVGFERRPSINAVYSHCVEWFHFHLSLRHSGLLNAFFLGRDNKAVFGEKKIYYRALCRLNNYLSHLNAVRRKIEKNDGVGRKRECSCVNLPA